MTILEKLKTQRIYLDGATGSVLQAQGLMAGSAPEEWNLTNPVAVTVLHKAYFDAGADVVVTNTFGVNSLKYSDTEKYISAAIKCAKAARGERRDKYIAFDMGPLGKLLYPFGDTELKTAYDAFAQNARLAKKYGADLILIETMNDCLETKAALMAVKQNCDLPVFVSNVYDERKKLMTGADAHAMIAMLEGLGADAIGLNCSLGPDKMIGVVEEYVKYASVPILVKPNAGLPQVLGTNTVYNISADRFAEIMTDIAKMGASILGGCCGTTPEYIRALRTATENLPFCYPQSKNETVVSSYTHAVSFSKKCVLIGERINPTGKKLIKEALRSGDYNYILSEGVKQADCGVDMLDVNAGLPEIDEKTALYQLVTRLQAVTDLPLQLDSTDANALESALFAYNGKPLINSVNGTKESMDKILPLVKKYGGAVIALTIGDDGIPDTALGRLEVARTIITEAEKYGISKKDIIVDPLALSVSSNSESAKVTLEAVKLIKEELGVCTSLGVSNISFGLPNRDSINSAFFTLALGAGLDAAIINPFSQLMMGAYYACLALSQKDDRFENYIAYATGNEIKSSAVTEDISLCDAVFKGLEDKATQKTLELVKTNDALQIINGEIIPALEKIGVQFESGKAFLPQLLMSAAAAAASFEVIKQTLPSFADDSKKIVLATVKGDIHDIGKNIVKALLQNFGFSVIDLGHDVSPKDVAKASENVCLVGLSALMTTTVPAMEQTIKLVREVNPNAKIMVGGAVLTPEYADMIGADFYAKDAMEAVRIAQNIFK